MTELLQGFEDLFTVVLYRLLLAFLLPRALARWRDFFLHWSRFFFPQVVQHGDFQLRSTHATSNLNSNPGHASGISKLPTVQVIHGERGGVYRELRKIFGLVSNVHAQTQI